MDGGLVEAVGFLREVSGLGYVVGVDDEIVNW